MDNLCDTKTQMLFPLEDLAGCEQPKNKSVLPEKMVSAEVDRERKRQQKCQGERERRSGMTEDEKIREKERRREYQKHRREQGLDNYYSKNKDAINAKRNARYACDPEYRRIVIEQQKKKYHAWNNPNLTEEEKFVLRLKRRRERKNRKLNDPEYAKKIADHFSELTTKTKAHKEYYRIKRKQSRQYWSPERRRWVWIMQWARKLKMDALDLYEKYKACNNLCECCGQSIVAGVWKHGGNRISLDHDHITGKFRGFLCHGCNAALGLAKEDPKRLRKIAEYIERFKK